MVEMSGENITYSPVDSKMNWESESTYGLQRNLNRRLYLLSAEGSNAWCLYIALQLQNASCFILGYLSASHTNNFACTKGYLAVSGDILVSQLMGRLLLVSSG